MQFLENLFKSKEFKIKIIDRNNKKHVITSSLLPVAGSGIGRGQPGQKYLPLIGETLKDILILWYVYFDQSNDIVRGGIDFDKVALKKSFGICGGCCACGSCHVYIDKKLLNTLPEMNNVEKIALKDFAVKLKDTSRLACQLTITEEYNNRTFTIAKSPPEETYGYSQHEIEREDLKQN